MLKTVYVVFWGEAAVFICEALGLYVRIIVQYCVQIDIQTIRRLIIGASTISNHSIAAASWDVFS